MSQALPELWPWQQSALQSWIEAGHRGMVAAATGTGKTRLALAAIGEAQPDRVVVVVPTLALQGQWLEVLRTGLRIPSRHLGCLGGRDNFRLNHRFTVAVINTARGGLTNALEYWQEVGDRVMVVVDECHWAGSETSRKLLEPPPDFVLGLSATPERNDDGFDELMVPAMGPVIFRYPLKDAIADGVLASIHSTLVGFALNPTDHSLVAVIERRIETLSEQIRANGTDREQMGPFQLAEVSEDPNVARRLRNLLERRHDALSAVDSRIEALEKLAKAGFFKGRRTVVFNRKIDHATQCGQALLRSGVDSAIEHSRLTQGEREAALGRFKAGAVDTLITVKALDEGIDLPDADTAVIVADSLNPRQRTQRIGRIARLGSSNAEVVTLVATNTTEPWELRVLDQQLLGPGRINQTDLDSMS